MKKVFVSICVAGAALAMSSCRSVEKAVPVSSINGEWNIIEVNGSKVAPGESRTLPFIAFDTATGRVSGNSGCNRMMGTFDVNAQYSDDVSGYDYREECIECSCTSERI